MNVVKQTVEEKVASFSEIYDGECFEVDGVILMRMTPITSDEITYSAVDLKTGRRHSVSSTKRVIKVTATVTWKY